MSEVGASTGSWLLYDYLEHASPEGRRHMENAIRQGDIAWHAVTTREGARHRYYFVLNLTEAAHSAITLPQTMEDLASGG
jgi:hypothetical protein